jgi:DNA-binding CsgD family transcriptional regulator
MLGALDIAQERYAGAETHLQHALTLAKDCAAPFEVALTLLDLAELRLAQRRSDNAIALLDDVQTICERLGAKPTLERVDDLRQRMAQLPTKAFGYPAGLSQREVEVLRLVAEGLTDADVAERLFISRRTVTSHLTSIYNKIGIGSRAAASVWAKEHDLI